MHVEVKICGLTTAADALVALEAGADYLGVVFYPESPRAVTVAQVRELAAALPDTSRLVGVFVNSGPDTVRAAAEQCGLYAVQVHGDEPPEGFASLPGVRVWRALHVGQGTVRPDPAAWPAARYVADASVPGAYGGTGEQADWALAARVAAAVPMMLAGGLTPDNVQAAIRAVSPLGVDVSSGVESAPGRKDHAALAAFVRRAKDSEL